MCSLRLFFAAILFCSSSASADQNPLPIRDYSKSLNATLEPIYRNNGLIEYTSGGSYTPQKISALLLPRVIWVGDSERSLKSYLACRLGRDALLSAVRLKGRLERTERLIGDVEIFKRTLSDGEILRYFGILYPEKSLSDSPPSGQTRVQPSALTYPRTLLRAYGDEDTLEYLNAIDIVKRGLDSSDKGFYDNIFRSAGLLRVGYFSTRQSEISDDLDALRIFIIEQQRCAGTYHSVDYIRRFQGELPIIRY